MPILSFHFPYWGIVKGKNETNRSHARMSAIQINLQPGTHRGSFPCCQIEEWPPSATFVSVPLLLFGSGQVLEARAHLCTSSSGSPQPQKDKTNEVCRRDHDSLGSLPCGGDSTPRAASIDIKGVTFKPAVVAQYFRLYARSTHGHLLTHRVFLHSCRRHHAQRQSVTLGEHSDRSALEASAASPARTTEDNQKASQGAPSSPARGKSSLPTLITIQRQHIQVWSTRRALTVDALGFLGKGDVNDRQLENAVATLTEVHSRIKEFYNSIPDRPAFFAKFAACLSAEDLAASAVQAREVIDGNRTRYAFEKAYKAALEASGVYLDTPSPVRCKPGHLKKQNYEWMLDAISYILEYRTEACATLMRQNTTNKDEPEDHDDVPQTVSEPFAPSKDHEDNSPDSSRRDNSLEDHLRRIHIYLPVDITVTVFKTLNKLVEESCYRFALVHIPHHLAQRRWDYPEAVELISWYDTFAELLHTKPWFLKEFDIGTSLRKSSHAPTQLRILWILDRLRILKIIRNIEAHRDNVTVGVLLGTLTGLQQLALMLKDSLLLNSVYQLYAEVQRISRALRARRNESQLAGRTLELWNQIHADKAALQRVQDQFKSKTKASISPEHFNAYTVFKEEVELMWQALPVVIRAEDDLVLQAELPSLVKMVEAIAEQVAKRNAELRLEMQAKRKSEADVILNRMSLLLETHKYRMSSGSFPFSSELSSSQSQLGPGGHGPTQSEHQGSVPRQEDYKPQENAESREQQHHDDIVAAKQEAASEQRQEEEEMENEQVRVKNGGEERQRDDFEAMLAQLVDLKSFSLQTPEELREQQGLTRRHAGIASRSQLQTSGLLKEFIKRKDTLLGMKSSLREELNATKREIRALSMNEWTIEWPATTTSKQQKLGDDGDNAEPATATNTAATTTQDNNRSTSEKLTQLMDKMKLLKHRYDLVTSPKTYMKLQASFKTIRDGLNNKEKGDEQQNDNNNISDEEDDATDVNNSTNTAKIQQQEESAPPPKIIFNDRLARERANNKNQNNNSSSSTTTTTTSQTHKEQGQDNDAPPPPKIIFNDHLARKLKAARQKKPSDSDSFPSSKIQVDEIEDEEEEKKSPRHRRSSSSSTTTLTSLPKEYDALDWKKKKKKENKIVFNNDDFDGLVRGLEAMDRAVMAPLVQRAQRGREVITEAVDAWESTVGELEGVEGVDELEEFGEEKKEEEEEDGEKAGIWAHFDEGWQEGEETETTQSVAREGDGTEVEAVEELADEVVEEAAEEAARKVAEEVSEEAGEEAAEAEVAEEVTAEVTTGPQSESTGPQSDEASIIETTPNGEPLEEGKVKEENKLDKEK
ncbi:hypothetical protein B0T20DRAFT_495038 [Sordaria brevicollis]|uniref:Uncharacterized protein n=1 Tax=Sordaria brevicollis TaxID=83679 RepID=A0AAE0PIX1_SORBR|nr:hypothetical protein B0T20DRAFT_495038 [Sordaria brevicollis]